LGTWTIIDRVERLAENDLGKGDADVCIFAPSLRALPPAYPIAMATLPVIDWNAELFDALNDMTFVEGKLCYAAVLMIDPFTLWEDLADLLKEKGFAGVVNFPPASLAEGVLTAGSVQIGNTLEIDRMKWFHDAGLRIIHTASSRQEMTDVSNRLADLLDGMIYFPPDALTRPVAARMDLEPVTEAGSFPASVWSLKTAPLSPAVEADRDGHRN
jgi:predicted TIM-barrel enzyme